MLSLRGFNLANPDIQASETHLRGEHVYTHILEEGGIILYTYNNFLIEAHYNANFQAVDRYSAINLLDAAEKYVRKFRLKPKLPLAKCIKSCNIHSCYQ